MSSETYSIKSKYKNITEVSNSVKQFCLLHEIGEEKCNDIIICLIEALNNVIKHSYKEEETKLIEIEVYKNENDFEIRIVDEGISRTNFEKPNLDFNPEDIDNLPEGGMGLFIIESLMDSTHYETRDKKNTFIMKKLLNN